MSRPESNARKQSICRAGGVKTVRAAGSGSRSDLLTSVADGEVGVVVTSEDTAQCDTRRRVLPPTEELDCRSAGDPGPAKLRRTSACSGTHATISPSPGCPPHFFRLLSRNLKVRIYKTVILPVVLYGCENWTLTLREEHRLRVLENKVLRKIFGAKRDEVTGEWRKLHNIELHALYSSPDIIRNNKSRRLRWTGHVARRGESRNGYRVLVGRPERKRPLGRPRRRWEDNIKLDLREVGYDDREWINLAQDRGQWRAYVRAAMNLQVLKAVKRQQYEEKDNNRSKRKTTNGQKKYKERQQRSKRQTRKDKKGAKDRQGKTKKEQKTDNKGAKDRHQRSKRKTTKEQKKDKENKKGAKDRQQRSKRKTTKEQKKDKERQQRNKRKTTKEQRKDNKGAKDRQQRSKRKTTKEQKTDNKGAKERQQMNKRQTTKEQRKDNKEGKERQQRSKGKTTKEQKTDKKEAKDRQQRSKGQTTREQKKGNKGAKRRQQRSKRKTTKEQKKDNKGAKDRQQRSKRQTTKEQRKDNKGAKGRLQRSKGKTTKEQKKDNKGAKERQ
ncbi:hypothetical protein ANN_17939 [Periplaneta americana]|uniref:Uncharacterized protein n=1 Tax=Periplaneta americana TaxID=6978 RepID=A0ABQ8SMD0_PERAM|nr:hypothetical protein ANN_17939 [Periplaneta americana]